MSAETIGIQKLKNKACKELKEFEKEEVIIMFDEFFLTMKEIFLSGYGVRILNIGAFSIITVKEHTKFNVWEKKHKLIKEAKRLTFRPCKKIRDIVKNR